MAFTISETTFGTLPALAIEGDGARVVLTLRGATVISWAVDGVELIDGYADELEFADQAGMRSAMMIPFSNRIPGGRYIFDGTHYDLNEWDAAAAGETVLHGMLRLSDFVITGIDAGASSAMVHLISRALRPGAYPGYPFAVDVTIDLTVTADTLEFVVAGTNVGDSAAPFGIGWHPYFTIADAPIETLMVQIPASTHIVVDPDLIPLEGDAAFEPVSGDYDWRTPRPIGDRVLDGALDDLSPAPDGLAHSTVTDPASGRRIDAWQDRGLMHIFTADTVTRPRGSFAMESVEFMTNAFGRPDRAANIRLEPGQRRSFRFGATTTLESSR
ncbi:aldose 1-epimerase [soil metagenome]